MAPSHRKWYRKGLKDGIPIGLGYFAVALAMGIAARNAGLTAVQATVTSLLINASAGQYVGFTLMAARAGLLEIALMESVANARYLLMSCALSQKLPPDTPLWQRMVLGFDVTDEIFGVSISVEGKLDPFYTFGAMTTSIPGWALGTFLGVVLGNALPAALVSALGVGLYGMFMAVFLPAARKDRVVLGLVALSFLLSWLFRKFHDLTVAVLIGLMAGSLRKVWPWKASGADDAPNVLPQEFNTEFWSAIGLAVAGFVLVLVLETIAKQLEKRSAKTQEA